MNDLKIFLNYFTCIKSFFYKSIDSNNLHHNEYNDNKTYYIYRYKKKYKKCK